MDYLSGYLLLGGWAVADKSCVCASVLYVYREEEGPYGQAEDA